MTLKVIEIRFSPRSMYCRRQPSKEISTTYHRFLAQASYNSKEVLPTEASSKSIQQSALLQSVGAQFSYCTGSPAQETAPIPRRKPSTYSSSSRDRLHSHRKEVAEASTRRVKTLKQGLQRVPCDLGFSLDRYIVGPLPVSDFGLRQYDDFLMNLTVPQAIHGRTTDQTLIQ